MARLLDDDGGHWSIRPTGAFSSSRRYVGGALGQDRAGRQGPPSRGRGGGESALALDRTVAASRSWSVLRQRYDGPSSDLVHTRGRVLKALTFQPSGAVLPAPTRALPEVVGGDR